MRAGASYPGGGARCYNWRMIEPEQEDELRQRVRRSLESILSDGGERPDAATVLPGQEPARVQAIVDEETERFYTRMGLVKHVSRSGRVFWVTEAEKEKLGSRRRRLRRRLHLDLDFRTIAIAVATALFAALLLAYLFATETIG